MKPMARWKKLAVLSLVFANLAALAVADQSKYPETIAVMQLAYSGELLAHARYLVIAAQATEEKYPRIAYLATSLAYSEGVHARNFRAVLVELGAAVDDQVPTVPVVDTKSNLKAAANNELEEIDTRYPQYLNRIRPEGYEKAIGDLTHAWESEKQHRALIERILAGTGMMFGTLVRKIEGNPVAYVICQRCGSTLIEMPKDRCPICAGPATDYTRIDPPN
jgi:rubrerythrin